MELNWTAVADALATGEATANDIVIYFPAGELPYFHHTGYPDNHVDFDQGLREYVAEVWPLPTEAPQVNTVDRDVLCMECKGEPVTIPERLRDDLGEAFSTAVSCYEN